MGRIRSRAQYRRRESETPERSRPETNFEGARLATVAMVNRGLAWRRWARMDIQGSSKERPEWKVVCPETPKEQRASRQIQK